MCRRPSSFVRVIGVCALLFFIMGCATARRFANTPQHLPLPEAFTAATHAVYPGDGWLSTFADKPLTALVKEALATHSDIRLAINRIRSARIASGDAAAQK